MNSSVHDHAAHQNHQHHRQSNDGAAELKDPVCGMAVKTSSPHHLEHGGAPYYFCSAGCKSKFATDPTKYLTAYGAAMSPADATPAVAGMVWDPCD